MAAKIARYADCTASQPCERPACACLSRFVHSSSCGCTITTYALTGECLVKRAEERKQERPVLFG